MRMTDFVEALKRGTERDMQVFLKEHPHYLSAALTGDTVSNSDRTCVLPQFRFGSDFVSDFVIVNSLSSHGINVRLVELEPPGEHPFTKQGTMARRLNEAYKQVTEWLTWIADNGSFFGRSLLAACNRAQPRFLADPGRCGPHGNIEPYFHVQATIIIGRRCHMTTADHKRRRTMRKSTSQTIEITHYDRVLLSIVHEDIRNGIRVTTRLVEEVLALGDVDALREIATLRTLTEPQIARLANERDAYVRTAIAHNEAVPREVAEAVLQNLLNEGDAKQQMDILRDLAHIHYLSESQMLRLAAVPDRQVRATLARNEHIARQVHEKLLNDSDGFVAVAACFNAKWAAMADLIAASRSNNPWRRARAASHPKLTDPKELDRLANDPSDIVRDALSRRLESNRTKDGIPPGRIQHTLRTAPLI